MATCSDAAMCEDLILPSPPARAETPMEAKLGSIMKFLVVGCIPPTGTTLDGKQREEKHGNFVQFLKLATDVEYEELTEWLAENERTLPEIQNEILTEMSSEVLKDIAKKVREAPFYTIMVDELGEPNVDMVDVMGHHFDNTVVTEKVAITLRWVRDDFTVHEAFVGLCHVPPIEKRLFDSNKLVCEVKDYLKRFDLSFSKVRGQCYDGDYIVNGKLQAEAAKQISDIEKRAVFTHRYGHSLTLACTNALQECDVVSTGLYVAHDITKLVECFRRGGILSVSSLF